MRKFVVIIFFLYMFNLVNSFEYDSKGDYDDDAGDSSYVPEPREHSSYSEDANKPTYDIKDAPKLFDKFVKDYSKHYDSESDYKNHYNNFVKNLEEIIKTNNNAKGYYTDINTFADLDEKEMASYVGGGFQ
uniref:Cathepsin propeptide inhibitor domain-containing protein n=1 Tax=Lonomia obliqua TaxID=304329 RepID=Q5MGC7_LONON|nr:hypothetical protein 38 [Lonomia obliqua]